jgi:hypothetical protein
MKALAQCNKDNIDGDLNSTILPGGNALSLIPQRLS